MTSKSRLPRRSILALATVVGAPSLAGCSFFRSDEALDVVVENEASHEHEVQIFILASTNSFERTVVVAPGDQETFEDAIKYPEHPVAVEYDLDLIDYPVHRRGTFALSEELERFGFRLVESDADGESIDVVTLRDYRDGE